MYKLFAHYNFVEEFITNKYSKFPNVCTWKGNYNSDDFIFKVSVFNNWFIQIENQRITSCREWRYDWKLFPRIECQKNQKNYFCFTDRSNRNRKSHKIWGHLEAILRVWELIFGRGVLNPVSNRVNGYLLLTEFD